MPSDRLLWGIKASLRAYVAGTGGELTALDGAEVVGEILGFPAVPGRSGAFRGTVRLFAHGGMLDSTLSDPEIDEASGEFSVRDARGERRAIALRGESGTLTLSAEGASFFEGLYAPGAELDPIRFD